MCRDIATPTSLNAEGLLLPNKTLTGWNDIRSALGVVEELCNEEPYTNARIEVYQHSANQMSLKVTLRSIQELDDYLNSRFRQVLEKEMGESFRLSELELVSSRVRQKLSNLNDIHGYLVLEE
jgi:hypothetical protein